jgi:hypothetical protein
MAVPITLQLLRCLGPSGPKHTTRPTDASRVETQMADAKIRAPAWQRTGPAIGRGLHRHVLFRCQGLPGRARARPKGNSAPIIPDGVGGSRVGRRPFPDRRACEAFHKPRSVEPPNGRMEQRRHCQQRREPAARHEHGLDTKSVDRPTGHREPDRKQPERA